MSAEDVSAKRPLLIRVARALKGFVSDPVYRDWLVMKLRPPKRRLQWSNETRFNRYPTIFRMVARMMGREAAHRILSFGCSTGEEVFSLARWFPNATILGLDINAGAIATANTTLATTPDPRLSFVVADSVQPQAADPFDAVFCMAVLRDGRLQQTDIADCKEILPFNLFETAVADLARAVKPGGLLVIRNANFRFNDTAVSRDFETVLWVPYRADPPALFGPDNQRLPPQAYSEVAFRKLR